MSLAAIPADVDVVMTERLRRLFAAAGCSPTCCHACEKDIEVGETFQLLSYNGTDEMVHPKCGVKGLQRRDKKLARITKESHALNRSRWGSGYSRPTKPGEGEG